MSNWFSQHHTIGIVGGGLFLLLLVLCGILDIFRPKFTPEPYTHCSGCIYIVTSGNNNQLHLETMNNDEEGVNSGVPGNIKSASSVASVTEALEKIANDDYSWVDGPIVPPLGDKGGASE